MNATISEIMTVQPVTVSVDTPLPDVYRIAKEHSIHHLPVVDGGRLVGIISRTDLERVSFVNDPNSANVVEAMWDFLRTENLMTRSVVTIRKDQTVREAAELLKDGKIHALPVVEGGEIAGIVTTTDLIRYLLENCD
ncbi:MAG: CBS domain-containing protein [Acidobacteriota bacterium]|nr:MAG: CBS domain-containing protein [Acidobacteriota bacterium]